MSISNWKSLGNEIKCVQDPISTLHLSAAAVHRIMSPVVALSLLVITTTVVVVRVLWSCGHPHHIHILRMG